MVSISVVLESYIFFGSAHVMAIAIPAIILRMIPNHVSHSSGR